MMFTWTISTPVRFVQTRDKGNKLMALTVTRIWTHLNTYMTFLSDVKMLRWADLISCLHAPVSQFLSSMSVKQGFEINMHKHINGMLQKSNHMTPPSYWSPSRHFLWEVETFLLLNIRIMSSHWRAPSSVWNVSKLKHLLHWVWCCGAFYVDISVDVIFLFADERCLYQYTITLSFLISASSTWEGNKWLRRKQISRAGVG